MKKILSIFLILFVTVSLSACAPSDNPPSQEPGTPPLESPDKEDTDNDPEQPNNDEEEEEDEDENQVEDKKEKEVNLYFANPEYVELGDESLDHLKPEKRIINYEDTILEEAVVRELLKGPQNEGLTTTGIPATVKLLEVKVMDNIAYVDFSSDGLTGASLQETLTIEQIVESLTDLEEIDKVQFLVDGNKADSLMGHISIDQPFEGK